VVAPRKGRDAETPETGKWPRPDPCSCRVDGRVKGYVRIMRTKPRHLPVRLATGAYIVNAGLSKLDVGDDKAKQLHAMASGTYDALDELEPRFFVKLLAAAEIVLGTALIVPMVPSRLAGLGLGAFSGGLLGMYLSTPGMHQEGSIRPTSDGTCLAKDVWMLGSALSLVMDGGKPKAKRRAKHR